MTKSGNYLQLANVIAANWIQRRSVSNGRHITNVLMSKRKEKLINFKQSPISKIPENRYFHEDTCHLFGSKKFNMDHPEMRFKRRMGTARDYYPGPDYITLWYHPGEDGLMFYNNVQVLETYRATYFCTIGFNNGYFGIQHLTEKGDKQAIFSLWDAVNQERKFDNPQLAAAVDVGSGVKVERFGGEGTGWKTTYPYQWEVDERVHFLVKVDKGQDGYVHYTGLIYDSAQSQWKLMATLKRIDDYNLLKGFYSFLEDWYGRTGDIPRSASFDPWVHRYESWIQVKNADLTSKLHLTNINAWVAEGRFYMRTGGDTTNEFVVEGYQVTRNVNDPLPDVLNNVEDIINNQQYLP